MRKKYFKGFTLIELLAVILILGIIALIAVPVISRMIKESKRGAFETSVNNIVDVLENTCNIQTMNNEAVTSKYIFANGEISPTIDIKGSLPKDGTATVDLNCKVAANLTNGNFTAIKTIADDSIAVVDGNTLEQPVVLFDTNGNSKYSKSANIKITVSDESGLDESSLKYLWNITTNIPDEASITNTFTNNDIISSPSDANGEYYLWILAKDTSGNTAITRTSVFYLDNTSPVINLNGSNPATINLDDTYIDEGASATDNIDESISIVTTGTVNPSTVGTYNMTYSATDTAGNTASVTRQINVIDTIKPTIVFGTNGNNTYAKMRNTTVTVSDNGVIDTSSLKYLWNTSTSNPDEVSFNTTFTNGNTITTPNSLTGGYYLWILAKDSSGNVSISRTDVFNLDNQIPVITLNGSSSVSVNVGASYTDAGATATDNIDGSIPVTTTGTVNPNSVGTYTITYNATDTAGNNAVSVTRTINVIDVSAPVITMLGSNPVSINIGSSYTDAGATALDDVDGNVTSKITTTSTINVNALGSYTLTYRVTDVAGNTATAIRTVNVIDTVLPNVTFGTNGNSTYAKTRSSVVTLSDNVAINGSSLKYLWSTSTSTPSEASFTTSFTNGGTINSPAGATGIYYLWILGKDTSGNTRITGSNAFYLDNTVPVYSSYAITNVTSSGYDVYIYGVSDAHIGINKVQFPTWTDYNGGDDMQPSWETNAAASGTNLGSGTWYYRVNVSAHNNESGVYNTHVYIYDSAGNSTAFAASQTTVPPSVYYLVDVVNVGDFISYTGNNGCTNCGGQSVSCYGGYANTYSGWRVISKSGSGSTGTVSIVAAGTTECIGSDGGTNGAVFNALAGKYLNTTYAASARSINCNDALPYSAAACTNYTTYVADSMIQPGGFYYFATPYSGSTWVYWAIVESGRFNTNGGYTFGLRPIINFKSGVTKTGGSGTNATPYTISIQ